MSAKLTVDGSSSLSAKSIWPGFSSSSFAA